ncbi:MAG: peptidylprolyl isomerase [Burkholderiales bacterium]
MQITKNTVPTIRLKISDRAGKTLEDAKEPMVYLHGLYGNMLPKIEEALEGKEAGAQVALDLEAQDAFGARDEALARTIPKSEFPPGVKVGGQLEGRTDDGHTVVFNVVKIKGDQVLLDGNHAHAGKALRFSIKVVGVRAASDEEIAHGHAHGVHGHGH